MDDIDFRSLDDIVFALLDQIARYGGDPGVRDVGLLESAIAQPQATFDGRPLHSFPFEVAAAYLYHVVQSHPFVYGNKRTGAWQRCCFWTSMESRSPHCRAHSTT